MEKKYPNALNSYCWKIFFSFYVYTLGLHTIDLKKKLRMPLTQLLLPVTGKLLKIFLQQQWGAVFFFQPRRIDYMESKVGTESAAAQVL